MPSESQRKSLTEFGLADNASQRFQKDLDVHQEEADRLVAKAKDVLTERYTTWETKMQACVLWVSNTFFTQPRGGTRIFRASNRNSHRTLHGSAPRVGV